MIIVDIEGRLGNQMFQYTFAHGIAKVLNTRFSLNPIYKNELFKYFALDKAAFFSFGLGLKLNLFLKWSKKFKIIHQNGWQNNIPIEDNVHYKGFFQSELFFQENKDIIRNYFTIKKYWVDKFNEKYQDLFLKNKILVIHVRRTDYLDYGSEALGGKNLCLPISYYNNSVKSVTDLDQYTIICISDDIDYAKKHLKYSQNILFESNDTIVDYQLMLNANALIIANSSFAWWAAYLNNKPNKIVYSPKYWLGFKKNIEYPLGITSSDFIPVDVY